MRPSDKGLGFHQAENLLGLKRPGFSLQTIGGNLASTQAWHIEMGCCQWVTCCETRVKLILQRCSCEVASDAKEQWTQDFEVHIYKKGLNKVRIFGIFAGTNVASLQFRIIRRHRHIVSDAVKVKLRSA